MVLLKNPISKPIQKNNTICKSETKKKIYEKTIARRHHLNPIQPPTASYNETQPTKKTGLHKTHPQRRKK